MKTPIAIIAALAGLLAAAPAFAERERAEMIEAFEAYAVQKLGRHEEAFAAWMALAKRGNAHGILNVANAYDEGRGVEQNSEEAVRWYRKGAEQGDPHSLYHLARAYETGRGVRADKAKADATFERAAGAGSTDAQMILARALLDEDKDEDARYWLERAAQNGDGEASSLLSRLAPMSAEAGSALAADQRARIVGLLTELDEAANARDAAALTAAFDPSAEISVRLPGQSAAQTMTKHEYQALWTATFERADRFRFSRTKSDTVRAGEDVRVSSQIREYLTSGDRTQVLLLKEVLTVALTGADPAIKKVLLTVEER